MEGRGAVRVNRTAGCNGAGDASSSLRLLHSSFDPSTPRPNPTALSATTSDSPEVEAVQKAAAASRDKGCGTSLLPDMIGIDGQSVMLVAGVKKRERELCGKL